MASNDSGFVCSYDMTPKRQDTEDNHKTSIKIRVYDNECLYDTNGRETIPNLMDRMLKEVAHGHKPNLDRMLFKTKNDDIYLNLGLPTGGLKKDIVYECIFMGRSPQKTTDFVREYYVQEFHKDWNMNSFDVKFDSNVTNVSYMQKFPHVTKVRVNFFPEETLYEALRRDGRFEIFTKGDEPILRMHDFITVNCDLVLLSVQALKYAGQCLRFKKRKQPNQALPVKVSPLIMPSHLLMPTLKDEPVTPRSSTAELSHSMLQHTATSTPAHDNVRKLQSYEDLTLYIEVDLGLKLKSERSVKKEEQRKKKFENFFKENYQEFALHYPHSFSMSDLEHLTILKFSMGAVIAVNVSGVESFKGTCFRIGRKYVLTNYHVFKEVNKFATGSLKDCFVDFNYKGDEEGHSVHFVDLPLLLWSEKLDYAIIELDTMGDLPASMTDLGYSIALPCRQLVPGEHLSLVGHPNGMEKMVNISCPIKPPKAIEDHLSLTLHLLKENEFLFHEETILQACTDQNSVVYDVSNFFWGSSGSPGILIDEKLLIVLHFGGVLLYGKHVLERGMLLSSIVQDVMRQLDGDSREAFPGLDDIFGEGTALNFQQEPMETDDCPVS